MRRVWMIRPPSGKSFEDSALSGKVPADAGVRGDCSHVLDMDDALSLVMEENPSMKRGSQDSRATSLYSLIRGIEPGDLVMVPLKQTNEIMIGMARPESSSFGDYPARHVDVLGRVPPGIPADIRNSFSAHACVCRIQAPDIGARVEAFLRGEALQRGRGSCPWEGHDFALIVKAALMSEGYSCIVSPPGPDGGVDIRAGKGLLGTGDAIIVQVKSGSGSIGIAEIDRLAGILSGKKGVSGLLVAWSGVSSAASRRISELWPLVTSLDGRAVCEHALSFLDLVPERLHSGLRSLEG